MIEFLTEMERKTKNEVPESSGEPSSSRSNTDSKALKMMEKMGYKSGSGLGKHGQGISSPIKVNVQAGRGGFGLETEPETSKKAWDPSLEEIEVMEKVEWLNNNPEFQWNQQDMEQWPKEDKPIEIMDDQCNFCEKETLIKVLRAKDIFEELDFHDLNQARARANPFEMIRAQFFMNRAALKMANIDAATDFIFTKIDDNPHHANTSEPYYFADVCAGPGGFTEYILWRKKWHFKGFGLTLKGEHDFKLSESVCATPVPFQALYGAVGDGNVCCPENIADFREKVRHVTGGKGVHFMMSDGGFSVEGKENIQEVLSKNIYICQCLVALQILRTHGHFVTKVFDLFTCFSVGLLFLMYKCFEKVSVLKPNSSRPANSERYFICYGLKDEPATKIIKNYLEGLVDRLWGLKDNNDLDITEIVPLEIIKNDNSFYNYITASNNKLAKRQTVSLRKLATFCRNPSLREKRQEEMKQSCLNYWNIPKKMKSCFTKFAKIEISSFFMQEKNALQTQVGWVDKILKMRKMVTDLSEWRYSVIQSDSGINKCTFYAGFGQSTAYKYQNRSWNKVKNLQLVHGTFLFGELVRETTIAEAETIKHSLHVIDALRLGDENIQHLSFEQRSDLIKVYCAAVNRDFNVNAIRLRSKVFNKLEDSVSCPDMICRREDGSYISELPVVGFSNKREFFEVNSVVLLKLPGAISPGTSKDFREVTKSSPLRLYASEFNKDKNNRTPLEELTSFVKSLLK